MTGKLFSHCLGTLSPWLTRRLVVFELSYCWLFTCIAVILSPSGRPVLLEIEICENKQQYDKAPTNLWILFPRRTLPSDKTRKVENAVREAALRQRNVSDPWNTIHSYKSLDPDHDLNFYDTSVHSSNSILQPQPFEYSQYSI